MDILGMPKVGVKKLSNSRRGRKEPQSLDEVAINLQISQEIIKECQNAEAIRKAIRAGKLVTMPFSQILSL